jgi:prolycopene isomerase
MDMATFVEEYPMLAMCSQRTWGDMVDAHLHDPKLKAVVSALWGYFGLPPARLASFYYAIPAIAYLEQGGYYPKGRSQAISNALVQFIEKRGGKLLLNTRVDWILTKDGAATGVHCANGEEFQARSVVSNASAQATFSQLLEDGNALAAYRERLTGYSVSLSSFQVFLGLKDALVSRLELPDAEVFFESGYDSDVGYRSALNADVEHCGFGLMLYDNVLPGCSPKAKNTVNMIALQGFGHWEQFEKDCRRGEKTAYNEEKNRIADILIRRAEEKLLPGLAKAIEVKEAGTPLTNVRYTGNYLGAIYGWDLTLDNSGDSVWGMPHR